MSETREAAKRLCHWLDEKGLKPLPQPNMVILVRKGKHEQPVKLMRTDAGQWCWWWCWEPYRTDDNWEYELAVPVGQEQELAKRLENVLSLSALEEKVIR